MELADKSMVLEILRMPRLGLAPDQVLKIERIIDGKPAVQPPRPWATYAEAMEALGLKSRQGVRYRIKDGVLDEYVPAGRTYAVGVTRESLERALNRRAG